MGLVVVPLDMAAKGSYRKRKRMLEAMAGIGDSDVTVRARSMANALELLESQLRFEGEGSLEDALDELTGDESDELLKQLLASPVPPVSAVS